MSSAFVLLRCIGKAAVKNIVNLVSFGVGGDILVDAWDYWQKATRDEQRPADVQAVAQMSAAELRAEVVRIVREEAAALPAAQQAQLASYLGQVPAMIRRSLRRPSDPTGTTIASGTVFRKPEDLLPLLPASLPRFKAGDRPAGIGDWELVELLGVGGFGEVWKARNPHFDGMAPVALKFCLDAAARDRLLKHEAAVLNQVMRQGKHDGIVPLLHTYLGADPPCLAYEYIDGGDLAGLIQERRDGLPPQQAARVIHRLAEIVGFAHRLQPAIVHRDLKPANILVKSRPDGKVALRITDFGIGGLAVQEAMTQARRGTKSGDSLTAAVRGSYTPLYASPQQMRGDKPDPRDDVYALGVIWYQLLTGDLTKGRPGGDAWRKRLADRDMTPELLALLASSYEDERADRPASAVVLAEKLDALLRPLLAARQYPNVELVLGEKLDGLLRPSVIVEALPVEKPRPAPPRPEQPRTPERVPTSPVEEPTGKKGRVSWGCGLLLTCSLAGLGLTGAFTLMKPSPSASTMADSSLDKDGMKQARKAKADPSDAQKGGEKFVEVVKQAFKAKADNDRMIQSRKADVSNSIGMKFAWCPPGTFLMGSPPSEAGRSSDETQHKVTLTKGFYLGTHEVTQNQWRAVMGNNPSIFKGDNLPVEQVTWKECQDFCTKLGQLDGKRYRLPTEAEWEYACRAGSAMAYFFGDDPKQLGDYAWYNANAERKMHEVGTRKANAWGMYDMHGNVWEWCQDWYGPYPPEDLRDPQGCNNGDARVLRGGIWNAIPRFCRAAYRYKDEAGRRFQVGCRVALCLD
jgi:formylglycine-generating enzyme required for sulfatase activity